MLLITWLFDKLGYMPKITVDTTVQTWPFPETPKAEPAVKKPVAKKKSAVKKPAVVAKTARTKKAK